MKVFIIGCDNASVALWVIRSLGRKGCHITLGTDSFDQIACKSKYVDDIIKFNNFMLHPLEFIHKFKWITDRIDFDITIPINDAVIVPLMSDYNKYIFNTKIALPESSCFKYVYDKTETYSLAQQLNIPVPKNFEVSDINDLSRLQMSFPLSIKPAMSKSLKDNRVVNLSVKFCNNINELYHICDKLLEFGKVSVQEIVYGKAIGQYFLMNNGKLLYGMQQLRIHQPEFGGGSSYRKSVALDKEILRHSLAFLQHIKWNGLAMVEYIVSDTGVAYLMEVNGRLWGSLPLSICSGIDFPWLLVQMMNGKNFNSARTSYKTNIFVRNYSKDIHFLKKSFTSNSNEGQYCKSMSIKNILKHFFKIFKSNEHIDEFYHKDPFPFIYLNIYLLYSFVKNRLKKVKLIFYTFIFSFFHKFTIYRKYKIKKMFDLIKSKKLSILFVCKGNICRSPFAEKLLTILLNEKSIDYNNIFSCGISTKADSKINSEGICAASKYDISLGDKPVQISVDLINKYSIIFVFELKHKLTLSSLFPNKNNKFFLLGLLKETSKIDIDDPYNKSEEYFSRIFDEIYSCLIKVIKGIK